MNRVVYLCWQWAHVSDFRKACILPVKACCRIKLRFTDGVIVFRLKPFDSTSSTGGADGVNKFILENFFSALKKKISFFTCRFNILIVFL